MKKKFLALALCLTLAIGVFAGCAGNTDPCANGHDWGAWTITTPATETTDGLRERECSRCGAKDSDTIPKTGTQTPSNCTDCGKQPCECPTPPTEMTDDEIATRALEIL